MKSQWMAYNAHCGRIFKLWRIKDDSGKVATVAERKSPEDEHAAALLIAAAPELLRALRHMIEMVDACHDADIVPAENEWPVLRAREAVAKAQGKALP